MVCGRCCESLVRCSLGSSPQPAPSAPRHQRPLAIMRVSMHEPLAQTVQVKNLLLLPGHKTHSPWAPEQVPSSLLCLSLLFYKLVPSNFAEHEENQNSGWVWTGLRKCNKKTDLRRPRAYLNLHGNGALSSRSFSKPHQPGSQSHLGQ